MKLLIDLHMHTDCSDGELTVQEIVKLLRKQNVTHFSIADHDTLQAYEQLQVTDLHVIPALEFNTDGPNGELHILGYQLDVQNEHLQQYCAMRKLERQSWAQKIVEQLQWLGLNIQFDNVKKRAKGDIIVRTHIAEELVEQGYFEHRDAAFSTLLAKGKPAFISRKGATSKEAIDMIHQAGGFAVLAHPGIYKFHYEIKNVIKEGIDGIEVYYPLHSSEQIATFKQIAKENQLFMTVGSDFHGLNTKSPHLPGSVLYDEQDILPFIEAITQSKEVST